MNLLFSLLLRISLAKIMLSSFSMLVGKDIIMSVESAFCKWTWLLSALISPSLCSEILMCGMGKREVK